MQIHLQGARCAPARLAQPLCQRRHQIPWQAITRVSCFVKLLLKSKKLLDWSAYSHNSFLPLLRDVKRFLQENPVAPCSYPYPFPSPPRHTLTHTGALESAARAWLLLHHNNKTWGRETGTKLEQDLTGRMRMRTLLSHYRQ